MSKPKRKKTNVVQQTEAGSKTTRSERSNRRTGIIIAAVIIPLILIVAGAVYYQLRFAPFQQPVLTVDKTVIRMDYFLKRAKMAGDPVTTLQQLADEQLVKEMAPSFGITVTPQEIDSYLLTKASSENATGNLSSNSTGRYLTESEFKSWYQQQLDLSDLSDAEYKDMTGTYLLGQTLKQDLAANVAANNTQVHLNVIVVANSADAAKAKLRIQQGENFTAVARDVSLDAQSKDNGGDIGWVPPGVLGFNGVPIYDSTIFALPIGAVSDPMAVNPSNPTTSQYLLFMVSEKDSNRVIDDNAMQALKLDALSNWLFQEAPSHSIIVNYDFNNAANQAWIDWQLSK